MLTVLLVSSVVLAVQALPKVPEGAEAVSLFGKPLLRPAMGEEASKKAGGEFSKAERDYEKDPSEDNAVWVGRRIAYLGRFRDSVEWYTSALEKHKDSAKLLRHRGHRYITIREFDRAVADFERAAKLIRGTKDEVEPDGVPNARNQPVSSLHSNVWYHLALAHWLKDEFEKALAACDEGMKASGNPDRLVSQTYWRYLILRRLGREDEAKKSLDPINKDLDLIENHAYLRLLLVFKGELSASELLPSDSLPLGGGLGRGSEIENPTIAFGLGAFALVNGDSAQAKKLFERATSSGSWAAFGFIAAEAELKRMSGKPGP